MPSPIPALNGQGVIPPIDVNQPAARANRSPYEVSLVEVVQRFATSAERCTILQGLLDYRAVWHACGFLDGYQWLDGSFVEDVETIRNRPPRDIDVMTFVELPNSVVAVQLMTNYPLIFGGDVAGCKAKYHVDGFITDLNTSSRKMIENMTYWYGLFSHQRDTQVWKGVLRVDMAPTEDGNAAILLAQTAKGFTP